jgi:hypothetical protein
VSPVLQPAGSKRWLIAEGETQFRARMQDQAFMSNVERRKISFAAGDTLDATLVTEYVIKDGIVQRTYHKITKVEKLSPGEPPRQLDIDV